MARIDKSGEKPKKVVAKNTKKFPFEKEHLKDNRICKVCGKVIGATFLIGGICKNCHFKLSKLDEKYRKGFKVSEIEIRGM